MTNEEIIAVGRKLDALIAILLNQNKIEGETSKVKIALLIRLGFENQEIADILDTTLGLVSKERSLLKTRRKNER